MHKIRGRERRKCGKDREVVKSAVGKGVSSCTGRDVRRGTEKGVHKYVAAC